MITPKQRAVLRGLANTLDPVMQIGKDGITEGTLIQADELFEARELFKINVLKNCPSSPREIVDELAQKTGCDVVQCIGNKLVVYRRSKRTKVRHIELI